MNLDSSPEVEAIQFRFFRDAPAWRKLQMVAELNRAARELALSGIRQRYPDATPEEHRRYLADLLLGSELAAKVTVHCPLQSFENRMTNLNPIAVALLVTDTLDGFQGSTGTGA